MPYYNLLLIKFILFPKTQVQQVLTNHTGGDYLSEPAGTNKKTSVSVTATSQINSELVDHQVLMKTNINTEWKEIPTY